MSLKIGINGFGRIGRLVLKAALPHKDLEIAAVNDLADAATLAHLFKYDSTFGRFEGDVSSRDGEIRVNGRSIRVTAIREPRELPWRSLGVEIVVESTGRFTDAEKARGHLEAGARRVIISAPAKNEDITLCMGVNEEKYDPKKHFILSNASCTTNCLAPMCKILRDAFGLKRGLMTTVHAMTNDQVVLDFLHKDLRRARAALASIIPTTTGAARAIGLVLPDLKGKLNGMAIRVPTQDVSVVDLVCETEKPTTKEEVNEAFRQAAEGKYAKYVGYTEEPLVSRDFQGDPRSCIIDGSSTDVVDGTLVKVIGWYDNEWGYANRVVDLIRYIAGR